ncbi:unnamed protein product [Rhizophagus irregularis]|nr:unnamed protein product [Rhizophagus irregularis]
MGRHKDRSINVNNKKPYKKYTLPDQEEIDRLINKSTVLNTKRATTAWLNKFENFRSNVKYIGKCTEVAGIHELEVQIQNFIVVMKTKYGEDYKATSINACIDALNRHLNQYSVIRPLDLKDRRMFPSLWQILDGKLKDITEQGKGEIKGSDSLSLDEVKLMFNSPILSTDTPTGLLKTVFFYNALFLGLRGGVGDTLKIPSHPQIISVYEKYFAKRPVNANPQFYLQEYTDENDYTYLNKWYKTNNIGEKRMRTFLHELAKECGIDVMGRKITNHSVRKTLVELLKDLGFSDIEVMSVSRHHSLNGLKSYERSKSKMQDLCLNGLSQALDLKNDESETNNSEKDNLFENNSNDFSNSSFNDQIESNFQDNEKNMDLVVRIIY